MDFPTWSTALHLFAQPMTVDFKQSHNGRITWRASHVVFRPQTCTAGSFSEFGIHQYQHMNLISVWQPGFDIHVSDELLRQVLLTTSMITGTDPVQSAGMKNV